MRFIFIIAFCYHSYELAPSVEAVKASCNLSSREIPSTVVASGFSNQEEVIGQVGKCVTRDLDELAFFLTMGLPNSF